jgi:hypothetical protein
MNAFSIPIHLEERDGLYRHHDAIRIGVPLPKGLVRDASQLMVSDVLGQPLPYQGRPLAYWQDRSVKWLLLDSLVRIEPLQRTVIYVRPFDMSLRDSRESFTPLTVTENKGSMVIDTGVAKFEMATHGCGLFRAVWVGPQSVLANSGSGASLIGSDAKVYDAISEELYVEEQGALVATLVSKGKFGGTDGNWQLHFTSRAMFVAGSGSVLVDFEILNPRAAVHAGGLWDLGDPNSLHFDDLSLWLHQNAPDGRLSWYSQSSLQKEDFPGRSFCLYQDSSGGDRWDSRNHIDRHSKLTVKFRGYRAFDGSADSGAVIAEGRRASPAIVVECGSTSVAATVKDFWQNFPKALRWHGGALSIGLFPRESQGGFELQGGEKKRHTVLLDFGPMEAALKIRALQSPLSAWVDPEWTDRSRTIYEFAADCSASNPLYLAYINHVIEGPNSFFEKRELIDEYGWRNFGDLYADHESAQHTGRQPFVSHYNNQYDFVYGAFLHFHRTGDPRWRDLMANAARHTIDIDVYHTGGDKPAFNGGMFWHTDHYKPAASCTHRSYSRSNRCSGPYGGGPSNEHNYTSGILHYYYLTGDPSAAATVLELADWVISMDDGARTLLGIIDPGPTGDASKTVDINYHRPGRGAGNSINAMLDAYSLRRDRRYLQKAEQLIQRCIHPADDLPTLALGEPEYRWSYLVFLQVLGKYLDAKQELLELDFHYHYARESLLHYASWIADYEQPYKDVLNRVLIPTETWPAQDVRKAHVLYLAAYHCGGEHYERFRDRADFFFGRCLSDLLSFKTAYFTRPLVILSVYGLANEYHRRQFEYNDVSRENAHEFGAPRRFIPQRAGVRATLHSRFAVLSSDLARRCRESFYDLKSRVRRSE